MPRRRAAWRPPGMRIRKRRKAKPRTMVREYQTREAFERDAGELARSGWAVASVAEVAPTSGMGRMGRIALAIATLGLAARRKPTLLATYRRSR